jgi:hypothetical protein
MDDLLAEHAALSAGFSGKEAERRGCPCSVIASINALTEFIICANSRQLPTFSSQWNKSSLSLIASRVSSSRAARAFDKVCAADSPATIQGGSFICTSTYVLDADKSRSKPIFFAL